VVKTANYYCQVANTSKNLLAKDIIVLEAVLLNNITIEEYLATLQDSDQKYEYHDGAIFAMAGGTLNHSRINTNLLVEIGSELRRKGSECEPFNSDARLYIEAFNKIVFPDSMVVCGEVESSKRDSEAVTNPKVIIEVLSKTTESYDRGDKFYFYRQIPSLQEYILVAQDKYQVEVFLKGNGNMWSIERYEGTEETLPVASLGIEIPFQMIYRNTIID
jgi:Uma2 family endonuclease